jgi:4-hydroxy-tetrahydrodipicolinate reductase
MAIKVILAGATGWAGSALARAIAAELDIELVAAVSRTNAGRILGEVLGEKRLTCPVYATAREALIHPCDVFFDYTKPDIAKPNVLAALEHGAHVVIGTSGLTDTDYAEIAQTANQQQRGVLAVGNFALTMVLLQKFAETAARYLPQWEIIDYAHADKIDAPSGTARELADRLGRVRKPELAVALEQIKGEMAARGASLSGTQVHSVRLPGYTISVEIIFGLPGQQLSLRHDSSHSSEPYIDGALLAIRKMGTFSGLKRGLDSVMDLT